MVGFLSNIIGFFYTFRSHSLCHSTLSILSPSFCSHAPRVFICLSASLPSSRFPSLYMDHVYFNFLLIAFSAMMFLFPNDISILLLSGIETTFLACLLRRNGLMGGWMDWVCRIMS